MKNIFKFLGIALMACSLTMVACNKDDDKKTDSTADTGKVNPQPQPQPQPEVSEAIVAINSTPIDFNYTEAGEDQTGNYLIYFGAYGVNGQNVIFPATQIAFGRTATGVMLADKLDNADESLVYINADTITWYFFQAYPEYEPEYSFDATKLTLTCEDNFYLYNYDGYVAALEAVLAIDDLTLDDWSSLTSTEKSAYANAALDMMMADQTAIAANFSLMTLLFTNYSFAEED